MTLFFLSAIPAIAFLLYGFLLYITWRHGLERRTNRSFVLYLLSMMVWSLGALMMYVDRDNAPAWNRVMVSGVMVMPMAFFSFVQAFHPQEKYQRLLPIAVLLCLIMLVLAAGGYMAGDIRISETGLIDFEWGPGIPFFAVYFFSLISLSALSLRKGLIESRDYIARNRSRYVMLGLAFIVLGGLTNLVGNLGAYPIDIAANGINALILAYTIFRYNLLDITVVIRKGLLYTVPTVIIGVGYFLIILISVSLFHLVTGYQVFVVSVLVAAGVSLVMQPLQAKTQQWIDRLFFRERYDAGLMLERLSRTASSVLDLERLVNLILDETTATIHISKLALFLADEETGLYRLVAQRGLPADTRIDMRSDHPAVRWLQQHHGILTRHRLEILPQFKALWARERKDLQSLEAEIFVPLIAHNELIGLLVLGPKLSETSYTEEDGRTLMTLANQTAIAIQNARLYQTAIEEKIRSEVLVEHAFAGMIVVDQEMRIVNMNPAAEQVTGFTAQDLVGKTIFKVFGPEMWREGSSLRQAVQEGKTLPPTELSLATPAGRRDILLGMTPILDGYLFNFTDITKIKEFSRLQANIVANVSHELRTPLASIKGYTELLLEDYGTDDPESQRQFLQIIENEADRMGRIVKDLLDISRLEARSAKLPMEPVSLGDVVEETLMALSVQARKADVSLVSDLAPDAPPLRANKELMLSIVHNLVSNAIKYSHPGGQVDVVVRPEDGHVVLQVIDRGLGIPKADLPHLFTKFYRSGMAQKKGIRGTGLGLALVKEAVSVHKGRIDVQSQEGKGTTFTVWFPLATREDRSEPVPTPEQVLESIQPSRPGSS